MALHANENEITCGVRDVVHVCLCVPVHEVFWLQKNICSTNIVTESKIACDSCTYHLAFCTTFMMIIFDCRMSRSDVAADAAAFVSTCISRSLFHKFLAAFCRKLCICMHGCHVILWQSAAVFIVVYTLGRCNIREKLVKIETQITNSI